MRGADIHEGFQVPVLQQTESGDQRFSTPRFTFLQGPLIEATGINWSHGSKPSLEGVIVQGWNDYSGGVDKIVETWRSRQDIISLVSLPFPTLTLLLYTRHWFCHCMPFPRATQLGKSWKSPWFSQDLPHRQRPSSFLIHSSGLGGCLCPAHSLHPLAQALLYSKRRCAMYTMCI